MPFTLPQVSFTGGEISPSLAARTDLARYATALRTCRNFLVRPYGGIENRPGTTYIGEVKHSNRRTRLIPFSFSTEQNYVLEVGHLYLRIIKNGAYLMNGSVPREVATPWTEDDLDRLRYTQSADVMTFVHPDHAPRELRRLSESNWELRLFAAHNGPFLPLNVDEGLVVWASAVEGNVTLQASGDVWTADHVGALMFIEAEDLAGTPPWEANKCIASEGQNPYGQKRRNSDGSVYACVTNQTASAGNEIRTGNVEPTHDKGVRADGDGNPITAGSTVYAERAGVDWEYLHSGYGIVQITGYTSPTQVSATVLKRLPDDVVSTATYTTLGSFDGDGVTKTFSIPGATSADSADYRVAGTRTIDGGDGPDIELPWSAGSSSYTVNPVAETITFDTAPGSNVSFTVAELVGGGSTSVWALGAWSKAQGYPSVVTYFADRLVFAATPSQPQTVWMSKTSNYTDFGTSTPLVDDDAITFTINARQVNVIRELVPMADLVILTAGGEWRMVTDGVVSPTTISLRPQSYRGAADYRAEVIGNTALYIQAQGTAIRDLYYTFAEDGYNGADLTLLADHLFHGHAVDSIDFHQTPYSILWAVRDDGALLSCTYLREQEVLGWARHDTGDGDAFEDVCVIPEGDEDACYVVVRRTINGATKRYVERFATRRLTDIREAVFVDSALIYDGTNVSADQVRVNAVTGWTTEDSVLLTSAPGAVFAASNVGDEIWFTGVGDEPVRVRITGYTSPTEVTGAPLVDIPPELQGVYTGAWALAVDTLSGIGHLEGRTVAVLADGKVQTQKVVTSGSITLDRPAAYAVVGLPITADAETLEVNVPGGESIRTKKKTIPTVSLIVRESRGLWAGSDADHLYEFKQRDAEPYLDPVDLLTGTATIPISSTWNGTGRVFVRQSDPLPVAILGILPEVEVGG